jgi:hypothetical protein
VLSAAQAEKAVNLIRGKVDNSSLAKGYFESDSGPSFDT